jgi:SAM-dependent methyltransferase
MKAKHAIDYSDAKVRREVLIRQRREIWTPEQVESLARHFQLRPGMKLLDAGCGFGYALRTWGPFCVPGGELVGLDRDEKLLASAARFARQEGLGKAARFVSGDICRMPLPDDTFDITIAHVVFCHLQEPEKALDEMIRVTRRGGCVAVFDNAASDVGGAGWSNVREPTLAEKLENCAVALRHSLGRKRLGLGDFSVGCYVPSWMSARGLRDIDARTNERVRWIAPPYSAPAQRTAYRNMKERFRDLKPGSSYFDKGLVEELRAGGCRESTVKRFFRLMRRHDLQFRKAVVAGTAAFANSGPFWCIWGFKP